MAASGGLGNGEGAEMDFSILVFSSLSECTGK